MDAPVQESVDFDHFIDDLEELVPMLIPGVHLEREASGLNLIRGRSDIIIRRITWSQCSIVMRFDAVRVLGAAATLSPASIADLRADIIGFLCGAPLRSFSIWPQTGPKPVLMTRRTRRPHVRLATWWSRERRAGTR